MSCAVWWSTSWVRTLNLTLTIVTFENLPSAVAGTQTQSQKGEWEGVPGVQDLTGQLALGRGQCGGQQDGWVEMPTMEA